MALSDHIKKDSPTNNFATWNSLARMSNSNGTFSDGNLTYTSSTSTSGDNKTWAYANIKIPSSGFYYIEFIQTAGSVHSSNYPLGLSKVDPASRITSTFGSLAGDYAVRADNGDKYNNGNVSQYANTNLNGLLRIAINMDTGKVWWGINSNWFASGDPSNDTNEAFSGLEGEYYLTNQSWANGQTTHNGTFRFNFGQDHTFGGTQSPSSTYTDANGIGSFYYQPPTGALALCTANLEDITPNVDNDVPKDYMKSVIWTGNGTGTSRTINVGFDADLIWSKRRDPDASHPMVFDSLRSGYAALLTSLTSSEDPNHGNGYINNIGSNSFTFTDGSSVNFPRHNYNDNNIKYVAWCWKAGGEPSGDGVAMVDGSATTCSALASSASASITPTRMSVNTKAGFSIVKYVGTGTGTPTIPYGLDSDLDFYITKNLDLTADWYTFFKIDGSWHYGYINLTNQLTSTTQSGNNGVLSLSDTSTNDTDNYIAYCWHSVPGYSAFGSYTGNGSADGPFVYTGFRPAWVMIKRTDASYNWYIRDNARNPYNLVDGTLAPNTSSAEDTSWSSTGFDFTSNGFKLRISSLESNASGGTYIYAAFAEQPLKYATAR